MTGNAIPSRVYVCENCGDEFESAWSHEEAEAEALENWGELRQEEKAVICDLCYRQFMDWAEARGLTR